MSGANADRGEHELTLGSTLYLLRPSFTAVSAIERKTDRSLLALTRAGNVGDMTLAQAGIVAAELIKAGAEDELTRRVSAEKVAEMIYEEGTPAVVARLTLCLLDAATGGRKISGEAQAEAEIPGATATAE